MTDEERVAYFAGDVSGSLDAAERGELDRVRALLADQAIWAEPDPALAQRIVDGIAGAAATGEPQRTTVGRPPSSVVTDIAERRTRRIRYAVLGAAAAVLLAIGLGVGLSGNEGQPTQFAASLTGTALAPGASGQATMTKTASGWRIHVQATGLPRRDTGAYYEAWLKNAAAVLVPIGTFNEGTDVTLWAGVPPNDFPILTITRQVVGGGPASSGQVVLVGPVEPAR
jgi:hypothetical protein